MKKDITFTSIAVRYLPILAITLVVVSVTVVTKSSLSDCEDVVENVSKIEFALVRSLAVSE